MTEAENKNDGEDSTRSPSLELLRFLGLFGSEFAGLKTDLKEMYKERAHGEVDDSQSSPASDLPGIMCLLFLRGANINAGIKVLRQAPRK